MAVVESDKSILAKTYARSLKYFFDPSLRGNSSQNGAFRYIFDEGGLHCSVAAGRGNRICLVSREEQTSIGRDSPSFVYVDDGCWADNADGAGTKRRDLVLVSGPHVYMCEIRRSGTVPESSVESVQRLLRDLAELGCYIHVEGYVRARDTLAKETLTSSDLFLFLGDLHLPPVSWFFSTNELIGVTTATERVPPDWICNLPAMKRQPNYLMRNYYSCAQLERERGRAREARGPITGNPDIFMTAGKDLVYFLNSLSKLSSDIKRFIHFIQTGDMFELWLGRDYQFEPDKTEPKWVDVDSPNRVSDWGLEIIIMNSSVLEAFHRLEHAGLKEIKYVWGNHDAYLMKGEASSQLKLPPRIPYYQALGGDLFCEHGHRFDRSNYDNTESGWFSGPWGANVAYYVPVFRKLEPLARVVTSIGHPSEMRDSYLLGATLVYLFDRYDMHKNPFSIYVMGHSHDRKLFRFNIRSEYHLYGGSP